MALITGGADKLKEMVVSFGSDDYAQHIASASLTASQSVEHWQGGTPDATYADVAAPMWTVVLRMSQANKKSASLFEHLVENAGTTTTCVLTPVDGGRSVSVTVVLAVPDTFGGDIGSWAEAQATLGVIGQPVFTHPV